MAILMLFAGLAAWIATSTIVEAEVFRDVREACDKVHDKHNNWWSYKLRYLIHCHMCTGLWVSAIIAIFLPPLVAVPVVGWGLTALAVKGIGHSFLILQKLAEAITKRNTVVELEPVEQVHYVDLEQVDKSERQSHIDEIRAVIHQEAQRKKNVGWPN